MEWIPWQEAYKRIIKTFPGYNLNQKILNNWARKGLEIPVIKKSNRVGFSLEDIEKWQKRLKASFVMLEQTDYIQCFLFAVESYYNPITKADFNRTKQRDAAEFLTNQIQGKLGEIALVKLLAKYGIKAELDFSVTGQIPSQDIVQISTRRKVWNNPALKVSIKSTKIKNILLAVTKNEAELEDRKSDLYVLSQVGLFPNHILRIIKTEGKRLLEKQKNLVPDFGAIPCRIGGWMLHKDLIESGLLNREEIRKKYGIGMSAPNYIRTTGDLKYEWEKLATLIVEGI